MQHCSRIGVDIGGTFTDFVFVHRGTQYELKILTTPDAPERAVIEGIREVLRRAGAVPAEVGMVVHGTTLATNAVIERKGAKVAFLTTSGFRDTLELAYEHRYDQYDLLVDKPAPLVPRKLRLPIRERLGADGRVIHALDRQDVVEAAEFARGEDVQALAVGFLHAYANPIHERAAAEILAEHLPGLPISLSSDVSPEIREYERFTTVTANAYVQPVMAGYLGRLERALRELGIGEPLLLIQSNGGLCDAATAIRYPVRLLESGPAGGAIFAASLLRELGVDKGLLLDIGGTTAKLCFIDGGQPQSARSLEVARVDRFKPGSGLPLRFPTIELCEIGAGGGSIARVDRLGRLAVGPESAASVPGPACYRRGGTFATVTDAHLSLGRLDPEGFTDGSIRLDRDRSVEALARAIAAPLSLGPAEAALGVIDIVNENMAAAAREHAIEVGRSIADRTLVAIGGAASLHAVDLARKLGMKDVIVPKSAGCGSAAGFLRAPLAFEKSRSHHQSLARFDAAAARGAIDAIVDESVASFAARDGLTTSLSAQMRYSGQGHEILVAVDRDDVLREGAPYLRRRFEEAYQGLYGRVIAGKEAEVLSWTVRTECPLAYAPVAAAPTASPRHPELRAWTLTERDASPVSARRLDREALDPGTVVDGPALIVDSGTTIFVPSGYGAEALPSGHLHLRPAPAPIGASQ